MFSIEIARNVRISVPAQIDHISTYVFLEQENWFEDEADFVISTAEVGSRMLDIGSSFGYYSLSFAKAAGPTARVWAFEPTPKVCEMLRESIRINEFSNLTLIETAVGAENGRCSFMSEQSSELNSVTSAGGNLEVAMASLDHLNEKHQFGNIDFIKLDVEGHETSVINGGKDFFTNQSPLIMFEIKAGNHIDYSAATMFEELGYQLYRLVPELGVLTPFDRQKPDDYQLNIFACKPDRASLLIKKGLMRDYNAPSDETTICASVADVVVALRAIPVLAQHAGFFEAWLNQAPADSPYLRLLRYWVVAQNSSLSASTRCAALETAASIALQIVSGSASLAHCITAARVLRSWGERGLAVKILQQILPAVVNGSPLNIDAPFFPLLKSYESWVHEIGPWFNASIIEAAALWSSFASFWGEPTATSTTELLARLGRQTPLFERRRQLRNILLRRQAGPESHPLLAIKTEENRNPAFWCRLSQG